MGHCERLLSLWVLISMRYKGNGAGVVMGESGVRENGSRWVEIGTHPLQKVIEYRIDEEEFQFTPSTSFSHPYLTPLPLNIREKRDRKLTKSQLSLIQPQTPINLKHAPQITIQQIHHMVPI